MASILSSTGISSGSIVQVGHITQSIDAFTGTQAYDITLSGSLTITGSVFLNTTINRNFFGTASYVITSSTADYGRNSTYAITTSFADNETSMVQLYHPPITMSTGSILYTGVGYITDESSSVGFTFPFDKGRIISASITSTVVGTNSAGLAVGASIFKNNTKIFDFPSSVLYAQKRQFITTTIDTLATASLGDRIYIKLEPNAGGGIVSATNVVHNINLFIKRNG
jgi:hypothetical protein